MKANEEKNTVSSDVLMMEKLAKIVPFVVDSFDIELARVFENKNQIKILDHYYGLYHSANYATFFTLRNLQNLSTIVFGDAVQRDFILSLSERVSISLALIDLPYQDKLVDHFVKAITVNKPEPRSQSACFMDQGTQESISLTADALRMVLMENFWLLITYLLLINFQRSVFFQKLSEKANGTKQ